MEKPEIPFWLRLHGVNLGFLILIILGCAQGIFKFDDPLFDILFLIAVGFILGSFHTAIYEDQKIAGRKLDEKIWKANQKDKTRADSIK